MHNYGEKSGKKSASIVGARGYTGIELARILLKYPNISLSHCFATTDFSLQNEILEAGADRVQCLAESQLMSHLTDVVFLATPAEVSLKLAPQILAKGKFVVDLSGAFRLKNSDYNQWYHFQHNEPSLLKSADYGLSPFCGPLKKNTQLVANPGCYATAISMALGPLLKRNLIDPKNIVIDAKSGTTGAGRKPAENLLFSEAAGECQPYRVGKHQHTPEIVETLQNISGVTIDPFFTTSLLATPRGIIAGIYATSKTADINAIQKAFTEEYFSYPLVRHGSQIQKLTSLKKVVGTPYTHISYELVGNKLYLFSCIDNLLKGAASQAVENLNRYLDLPLQTGL